MLTAMASAISVSLCGVLNTHFVRGLAGSTMRADAARDIIGNCASETTSAIASELGVTVEPMITSALSSLMSLRVLVTALVVSDASSSTIHLIVSPAIDCGSISIVFFSAIPSDAAGPVVDSVTPIVMSACAAVASSAASIEQRVFICPPGDIGGE